MIAQVSQTLKSHDSEINFTFPKYVTVLQYDQNACWNSYCQIRDIEKPQGFNTLGENEACSIYKARQGGTCNINRVNYRIYFIGK